MFSHDTSAIVFVNLGCINENGVKITFWENSLAYMHLMYKSPKKNNNIFWSIYSLRRIRYWREKG